MFKPRSESSWIKKLHQAPPDRVARIYMQAVARLGRSGQSADNLKAALLSLASAPGGQNDAVGIALEAIGSDGWPTPPHGDLVRYGCETEFATSLPDWCGGLLINAVLANHWSAGLETWLVGIHERAESLQRVWWAILWVRASHESRGLNTSEASVVASRIARRLPDRRRFRSIEICSHAWGGVRTRWPQELPADWKETLDLAGAGAVSPPDVLETSFVLLARAGGEFAGPLEEPIRCAVEKVAALPSIGARAADLLSAAAWYYRSWRPNREMLGRIDAALERYSGADEAMTGPLHAIWHACGNKGAALGMLDRVPGELSSPSLMVARAQLQFESGRRSEHDEELRRAFAISDVSPELRAQVCTEALRVDDLRDLAVTELRRLQMDNQGVPGAEGVRVRSAVGLWMASIVVKPPSHDDISTVAQHDPLTAAIACWRLAGSPQMAEGILDRRPILEAGANVSAMTLRTSRRFSVFAEAAVRVNLVQLRLINGRVGDELYRHDILAELQGAARACGDWRSQIGASIQLMVAVLAHHRREDVAPALALLQIILAEPFVRHRWEYDSLIDSLFGDQSDDVIDCLRAIGRVVGGAAEPDVLTRFPCWNAIADRPVDLVDATWPSGTHNRGPAETPDPEIFLETTLRPVVPHAPLSAASYWPTPSPGMPR